MRKLEKLTKIVFNPRFVPFLLLLSALAFSAWGIYMADLREDEPEFAGREIEVLIVPGQSAAEVASEFERLGVVKKSKDLAMWMARLGIDRRIRPGIYVIRAGRAKDVAHALAEARPDVLNVRILPGALFGEIAEAFKRKDGDVLFTEALADAENFAPAMRELLPASPEERVALLAPETYAVNPGETCADELVKLASRTWWKQHAEHIPEGVTSKDLRADAILASIVQKEALVDTERPTIAGVFKNRIRQDMPLQSCATVVHAWRLRGRAIRTVSYDDTKIDSPFNTYVHKGLPPEHIGVPSMSSWNAALKPAATDMLFFVAKGDGTHVFTKTYKEHLAAQRKIRNGQLR
ncbi:endolytic transglycosylase MltG [Synergistaceae bacterium OttesenSCG-928-I11]|nr:endolytic transglycosylase MltG [Synergistaceae bacterium OttesenSCG-928-I11]